MKYVVKFKFQGRHHHVSFSGKDAKQSAQIFVNVLEKSHLMETVGLIKVAKK